MTEPTKLSWGAWLGLVSVLYTTILVAFLLGLAMSGGC